MSLRKLTQKTKQNEKQTSTKKKTKKRSSGSFSTRPGDNFYTFINHRWLETTKIPPTKSAFGVSEEIEKRIEDQTQTIINECIELSTHEPKNPSYKDQMKQMLGLLSRSVITADTQPETMKTFLEILGNIQSVSSKEEVGVVIGEFLRFKIRTVLPIYGQYENKNNTNYTYTLGSGGLGLDASFYHHKSLQRGKSFLLYKHMLHQIGNLLEIPNYHCVVKLEKILAGILLKAERDTVEQRRTGTELAEEFPHIPFDSIFKSMELPNWKQRIFFVESLRWLHTVNKLFHHLGLDYWRLLLTHQFVLFALPWLPPKLSDLSFRFYRKQLRGQQEKLSRKGQAVYVVQQYATSFFSRLYVEEIVDPTIKPHVKEMIETILENGKQRLGTIEWLEPATREKAQEKIERMRFIVGYPDTFENHPIPSLTETNLLRNLLLLGDEQTKLEIAKLGHPITERKEWDDAVFVVNAYYYTQANEMVIPAGILQPPFYSPHQDIGLNYGGIGCILSHELTHAFDREGKEYDPQGFQKKWWTPQDNRNYNKQTKALIELYSKQKLYGFPVSGYKTLSENIADIGGMGIAIDTLHTILDSQKLTGDERKKAFYDFFTSYAISWRLKEKKKKRIQALITDKHAAPSLRVNLVVSQFQEWYDAFDIKPEDALYLPPEKRIRIF